MKSVMRSKKARRRSAAVLWMLGVAAAYYFSGRLGLLRKVNIYEAVVTPLWPATGIALAALLLLGLRVWPGIALGALLTVAAMNEPFMVTPSGLCIVAGNTLAPVCAFLALRAVGFRVELDRLRDGLVLVFLGAMAGMLVSATVGAATLVVSGSLSLAHFWPVWSAWWAGDATGVLVVTPLILVLRRARWPRKDDRWAEASLLAVVSVTLTLVATRSTLSTIFIAFPVLVWVALRFQLAGSAPCALLMSVMAIIAGTDRVGPFSGHSVLEVMLNLTALNCCLALTALLLAALVTEQQNIRRETERACDELAALVEELTPHSTVPGRPPAGHGDRGGFLRDPGI